MKKVYVKQAKNTGKGLFAKKNIKKGEVIFIVKGKIVKGLYGADYSQVHPRCLAADTNMWLSPLRTNPWWFINHSCKPNAGLKGKVTVVAMKNIKKGQEITIDYSTTEDDPTWTMKCRCGHKNCRKIIRSARFLPEKLFKKYKPYIPEFLQISYAHHNSISKTRF